MATVSRYPLINRHQLLHQPNQPKSNNLLLGSKRPHSPETTENGIQKRIRTTDTSINVTSSRDRRKEQKQLEREAKEVNFRDKYTRAFPNWVFYFDSDNIGTDVELLSLEQSIEQLGGTIEEFFSKAVTHLISDKVNPHDADKENLSRVSTGVKSSLKTTRTRTEDWSSRRGPDLIEKARSFGIKIWTTEKLASVTSRCLATTTVPSTSNTSTRSLTHLLESERIHGTSERDPTQKRHDFHYFTKGSYFVLVEDMYQELATIVAQEYSQPKSGTKVAWPVLHCDPRSRGPFIEFDEKEKRRWERTQQAEKDKAEEEKEEIRKRLRLEAIRRKAQNQANQQKGDLRRSVSLGNLHRQTIPDWECEDFTMQDDFTNASGYVISGTGEYVAASGNSVSLTSAAGTTSNAGYVSRSIQLPPTLQSRLEVITSRKPAAGKGQKGSMGPPAALPDKRGVLKKSRSTNSLRLPKREEGSKPGYCESCRVKFDAFKEHIDSRRHRKFAENDANFVQLDCVLSRVRRRTIQEFDEDRLLPR